MVKHFMAAVAALIVAVGCGDPQDPVSSAADSSSVTADTQQVTAPPACLAAATCVDWARALQGPCHQSIMCVTTVTEAGEVIGACAWSKDGKVAGSETPCDDNNACTDKDVCAGKVGVCAGTPRVCDDNNPCTSDSCDKAKGCEFMSIKVACSDNDACTKNDACKDGVCAGEKIACDDNNPCTSDSCDKVKGCVNASNTNPCDDANKCTDGDVCKDGACAPGKAVVCDDQNTCTDDLCNALTGCAPKAKPNGTVCSDGDPSTANDMCNAGTCAGEGIYSCVTDADCSKNIVSKCGTPTCIANTGGSKKCKIINNIKTDDGNPCTTDACDPDLGIEHKPLSGDTCQDGDICTVDDICKTGVCVPGKPFNCNDNNACTADACDSSKGCTHMAVAIDDNNPYTDDSCDPKFGPQHIPQKLFAGCMIPKDFIEGVEVKDCSVQSKYGKSVGNKKTYSDPAIGDAGLELLLEKVCGKLAAGNVLLLSAVASMPDGKPIGAGGEVVTVTAPGGMVVEGVVQEWSASEPERVITTQDLAKWCK